jgi:hypothetical protein
MDNNNENNTAAVEERYSNYTNFSEPSSSSLGDYWDDLYNVNFIEGTLAHIKPCKLSKSNGLDWNWYSNDNGNYDKKDYDKKEVYLNLDVDANLIEELFGSQSNVVNDSDSDPGYACDYYDHNEFFSIDSLPSAHDVWKYFRDQNDETKIFANLAYIWKSNFETDTITTKEELFPMKELVIKIKTYRNNILVGNHRSHRHRHLKYLNLLLSWYDSIYLDTLTF